MFNNYDFSAKIIILSQIVYMLFRYCTQEKARKIHTFAQSTTHSPSYITDPHTYELLICKFR
jgi:hypothetical protein